MIRQNQMLEAIQTAQYGTQRPYLVVLKNNDFKVSSKRFATRHLAWAHGENWKMLNTNYDYLIIES